MSERCGWRVQREGEGGDECFGTPSHHSHSHTHSSLSPRQPLRNHHNLLPRSPPLSALYLTKRSWSRNTDDSLSWSLEVKIEAETQEQVEGARGRRATVVRSSLSSMVRQIHHRCHYNYFFLAEKHDIAATL